MKFEIKCDKIWIKGGFCRMDKKISPLPNNAFRDRLKKQRKKFDLSQQECADILGVAQSTIGNWETGIREPCYDMLLRIIDYFHVSADYIFGLTDVERPMERLERELQTNKSRKIPIFRRMTALENVEDIIGFEEVTGTMAEDANYFGLKIYDDGMTPRIFGGDVVIAQRMDTIRDGRIVIVSIEGKEAVCRKAVRHENGLSLLPMNSVYDPLFFTNQEITTHKIRIYGEVVEIRGRL